MNQKLHVRCLLYILLFMISHSSFASAQERYYHLGKEQLQFKLAADSFQEIKTRGNWEEMFDPEGRSSG